MPSSPAAGDSWVVTSRALPSAKYYLICLPHAGAGASTYRTWAPLFAVAGIEIRAVQYPGRETRYGEAWIRNAQQMAASIANVWTDIAGDRPCALYGHSMGGLVGFELHQQLIRIGHPNRPKHLFLSGRNPPHIQHSHPELHRLPDRELLAAAASRYGKLPLEALHDPEVVAVIAACLRADFELVECYRQLGHGSISEPLTLLNGRSDPWVSPARMYEWQRYSSRPIESHWFAGDHFFHLPPPDDVVETVTTALRRTFSKGPSALA